MLRKQIDSAPERAKFAEEFVGLAGVVKLAGEDGPRQTARHPAVQAIPHGSKARPAHVMGPLYALRPTTASSDDIPRYQRLKLRGAAARGFLQWRNLLAIIWTVKSTYKRAP
jgi:hypothetical protein